MKDAYGPKRERESDGEGEGEGEGEDEMPFPLLVQRRTSGPMPATHDVRRDRLSPAAAGALSGVPAGAAALGVVHAMHRQVFAHHVFRLEHLLALQHEFAVSVAYTLAVLSGAAFGALLASVTKHLQRFVPLLLWEVVFLGSLTLVAVVAATKVGRVGVPMAPAFLLASAAYALIVTFQLPLRRRG
jgi:uncharacterized membrane protein YbjE (DUF340 family)